MKKCLVLSVSIAILLLCLTLFKPENKAGLKEVKLKEENNDLIGIYIKQEDDTYSRSKTVPEKGYVLNEKESYCKTPTKETEKVTNIINYDNNTQTLTVKNLNDINTKCFLYFDKEITPAADTLAGLGIDLSSVQDSPTNFNQTACDTGTNNGYWATDDSHNCDTTESGLFKGTEMVNDEPKDTYYYRGTVDNNWVTFARYWWRIIRINGNGSIRLIYSGSSKPSGDGKWTDQTDSQISDTSAFNGTYGDNRYVGYMYGTSIGDYKSTHTNTAESTIKIALDKWYRSYMTSYTAKLDGSAGFCNDRESYNGNAATSTPDKTEHGYSDIQGYYGPYIRMMAKYEPPFDCAQKSNDLFTTKAEQGEGNGALTYPVGLITADEVAFAGGKNATNYGYWLNTGNYYWTMSPCHWLSTAYVFFVRDGGNLYANGVYSDYGVRPVINLKANTTFKYNKKETAGTISDPYVVS